MGGGILSNLMRKVDGKIYSGLQSLSSKPNGIGMSKHLFKERAKQRLNNIDDVFKYQDFSKALGRDNIKIRNAGGLGSTPMLQEAYEILTRRK